MKNKSGFYKLLPIYLLVTLFVITLISGLLFIYFEYGPKTVHIKIGAGKAASESFEFLKGVEKVANELYEDVKIEIVPTGGSRDNLAKLNSSIASSKIDFGTIQSDVTPSENLRLIAYLYTDFYQLIVNDTSSIKSIVDLKDKVINITGKKSGQYSSLEQLLKNYQIYIDPEKNLDFTLSAKSISDKLTKGEIDAIFRVRSPLYPTIDSIVDFNKNIRFLSIDQGKSLSYVMPDTYTDIIPKGIYEFDPLFPRDDVNTLATHRLFVCNKNTDDEIVELMTELLFQNKYLLSLESSLANFISNPSNKDGTLIPIHKGAKAFFERGVPPWHVTNASFLSFLILSFTSLIAAIFGLNKFFDLRRKNQADEAMNDVIKIIENASSASSKVELEELRNNLQSILKTVVNDLDKIDSAGFNAFISLFNLAKSELDSKTKGISIGNQKTQVKQNNGK